MYRLGIESKNKPIYVLCALGEIVHIIYGSLASW